MVGNLERLDSSTLTSTSLESSTSQDDTMPALNEEDLKTSSDENDKYIIPDWSLVDPSLEDSKRIIVDFDINLHTDMYGLSDSNFSIAETLHGFQQIANIWAKANIWTRFKIAQLNNPVRIPDNKADAYLWWLLAAKPNQGQHTAASKRDYDKYLVNGPGGLGTEGAEMVLSKYYAHKSHDLFNWIIGAGGDRMGSLGPPIRLYFMYYFRWYNGMGNDKRIYVRIGSCNGPPKYYKGQPVTCKSWGARPWEVTTMAMSEFVRILAHEIGHAFGLHHPNSKCTSYSNKDSMQLMHQQVAVTYRNTPCGPRNPNARFATFLPNSHLIKAREKALVIMNAQNSYG
eukprot:CAMPEP_0204838834 /NCGR_PEP_ID=MMETSP1346-20131115/32109_1 /ASSEMBLY_ACC=CAM_ASM_000771 /TAXON_ID=215587 /ORGANISM="Aplanochytrium stocchinoi, Strain GSBS06" /LENGTH=341 /DNA_ID=CAMNT_0051975125 /DNA_START=117 /DNA_END=1142 /DNA_ORIENTATION=-